MVFPLTRSNAPVTAIITVNSLSVGLSWSSGAIYVITANYTLVSFQLKLRALECIQLKEYVWGKERSLFEVNTRLISNIEKVKTQPLNASWNLPGYQFQCSTSDPSRRKWCVLPFLCYKTALKRPSWMSLNLVKSWSMRRRVIFRHWSGSVSLKLPNWHRWRTLWARLCSEYSCMHITEMHVLPQATLLVRKLKISVWQLLVFLFFFLWFCFASLSFPTNTQQKIFLFYDFKGF